MSVYVKMTDPITIEALDYLRREFGILPSDVTALRVESGTNDVSLVTITMPIRVKASDRELGDPHGPHPHDGTRCLDCPQCAASDRKGVTL